MARGTARGRNKRSKASPDSCSNNQQEVRAAGKSVASRPKTAGDYSEASRKSSSNNKQELRAAGRGVTRRPKIDGNHSGSSSDKSQTLNHPTKRVFSNPFRRKAIKANLTAHHPTHVGRRKKESTKKACQMNLRETNRRSLQPPQNVVNRWALFQGKESILHGPLA